MVDRSDRTGFLRLRSVGPERLPLRRGRAPSHVFSEEERAAARHALKKDMFATTTWKVVASLHRTNDRILRCFGMTLMPFSTDTVFALASGLQLQKDCSAKN